MSAICQNFVQNAWKKELCSNCFKSKDEHAHLNKLKPLPTNDKPVESIIKTNKLKPKRSVCFTNQLSEIIGYGGEDWSSDHEDSSTTIDDDDDDSPEKDFETEEETDEEELCRLTKANTDFNTNALTAAETITEVKKSYTQLMLGKPQLDADGKKQTLLVSVTPFGQESTRKYVKPISSHIPIARNNAKEVIAETKSPNIVLKSYAAKIQNGVAEEKSLLDEISETLENGSNPIQIISRKNMDEIDDGKEGSDKENFDSVEVKKIQTPPERKNGLNRAPVILKRDLEKPVISTAKIELMNTRNSKFIGKVCNKTVDTKPEIKEDASIVKETSKIEETECKLAETSSTESEILTKDPIGEIYPQSREQAGEPDGRAEPDLHNEPPALPLTPPPPLEMQSSFLHGTPPQTYDKPKIPSKPTNTFPRISKPSEEIAQTVLIETKNPVEIVEKIKLCQQDSNSSESSRANNKRRAPQPPEEIGTLYARNSNGAIMNLDCPVVREKDKQARASSCSPKLQKDDNCLQEESNYASIPEPIPRKSLSISTDNLAEEKQKTKGRFSLKKFLRISKPNANTKLHCEPIKSDDVHDGTQKPRLVIVHPLDLSGAKVEVVSKPMIDQQPSRTAGKPPPPPRNFDEHNRSNSKPNLPTPPKSAEILFKQRNFNRVSNAKKIDTVYANIGEVRSAIVPNKPQRTASMREREEKEKQQKRCAENYEPINRDYNENVYDYINNGRSSSPEYDASPDKSNVIVKNVVRSNGLQNKRSESNIDVSGESMKFGNIPRSLSLTYCGSETESEIYSPYSFYGSESEVTEDDHDWIAANSNGRTQKLRSRKGRSIVHKNLEDNYGAVIVANHEALAQVLENIQQTTAIQPALRGLKLSHNLQWSDFVIKSTNQPVVVGTRIFHQALWGAQPVTLVISTGSIPASSLSLGTFTLNPITEFSDIIPMKYLTNTPSTEDNNKQIQATIAVLPWLQINTIQSYGEMLKSKSHTQDETWRDGSFVLLQLVNALKMLQAQGIEELPLSLTSFILCREVDKDIHYRLCVLQGLGEDTSYKNNTKTYGTLCMCASKALTEVLPSAKTTQLIQSLLNTERAVSLTQVKSVLEFSLWGPSDVALGNTIKERELALQRWLDLQRATVLHGLVCTRVQLTVYEESHLLFLVRSNARMMCDASLLLESSNMQQAVVVTNNGHK